ncbi:MAG TPA: protein kinase [Chthoniobacterales bacterium]|nr:protein kinase [Chthoniobacterales bacterium]
MNSAPLERLKEIFHSARELPPGERDAFLSSACGSDGQLRSEIEALLESDRAADDFIADPPAQLIADAFGGDSPPPSDAGRMIGQYKLIECIGSGGMGAVYLAERADQQFQMQVAIKLIKRGMDTDAVLRRFQHERQILASLEHPNIARLLDGGTTGDGVPYFVMEYIEGHRIDRYAEEHRLSISERLELFRQVCGAVSYAHQRLVVHRDLKPSNILVTPAGVPKLLDFGIAKIIQPNDSAEALPTITIIPIMTPEYASPEQVQGAPATTLSDVYSLGAVLFEVLTGRPPYRLQNRSSQEIEKAISTAQIERPSAVVSPEDARRLRGDLDNIVRMAMRKETAQRYRSVEQFSEDIRRHLAGRPVVAQPDTLSYRSAKFLRRNRLGVSAATLLFLTLVGGIVATAWQAHRATIQEHKARAEQARAERRFNDVRKLANSVLFDYHDAIKDLPGATKVRERLVRDALSYLDSLANEAHGDPELQRELAAAYERVGDVRGGDSSGSLGDIAGAVESYAKALRIREALVVLAPDDARAWRDLATSHQKIGYRLLDTRETSNGVEHLRKAQTLYLNLTREQPGNDDLQLELADTLNKLGNAMDRRGDLVGALGQHRVALTICEKLAASHPRVQTYRRELWATQERIATVLWEQNDLADALEANRKALALGEALIADDPINADYRRGLVRNCQSGGDYRRETDKQGALEYFRRALALSMALVVADPANALTLKDLGYQHKRIADFLANLEDWPQGLLHFTKALEIFEKLGSDAPADLITRFRGATCRAGVAGMHARLGEVEPALQQCRKAAALLEGITEDPANMQHRFNRAEANEYLGYAYLALAASPKASASESRQHMSAARDMFRQTLNILDDSRRRGGEFGVDEKWATTIAGEIAKCDTALAR